MNLIPNGAFESDLSEWESTPSGVTLVKTEKKRFVMLAAERTSAAICSLPVEVVPGAAYVAGVERAVRGDCEIAVIGAGGLLKPDARGEVVPRETPVRVQVTARPGHRLGVSRVILHPVGPRARLINLRSTAAFAGKGQPYQILCEVTNTGSEEVAGVARFLTDHHELLEEHKQEVRVAPVGLGGSYTVGWLVAGQRTALAKYRIEFEHAGGFIQVEGTTLRHVPHLPAKPTMASVHAARRTFSVSSRGIRVTAHETDMDYGPMLLSDDRGRIAYGVIQQMAQIVPFEGGAIPLWSVVKRVTPGGVELAGKNDVLEWGIVLRPDHHVRGIAFDIRLNPRRRLSDVNIEIAPFQTMLPLKLHTGGCVIGAGADAVRLGWVGQGKHQFRLAGSEAGGLLALRSERTTLMPGSMVKVTGIVQKADSSIIRSE